LVILETNDKFPVRVINTITGLVVFNITLGQAIYSANFIDSTNRFLFMQTDIGDIFYDTFTSLVTHYTMNATLTMFETRIDFTNGLLHNIGTNTVRSYGTNMTYNGTQVAGYYYSPTSTNTTANTTNATANTTNDTETNPTIESNFYRIVNYSEFQNTTLKSIGEVITTFDSIIDNTFSLIFSTPLTTFFLGTLNFFALTSLYIFLNINLPYPVYFYFSEIYKSCQVTILDQFGVTLPIQQWSTERVTN
jgi:hypothetical protein